MVAMAMRDGALALGFQAGMVPGFEAVSGDLCIAYGWAHPDLFEQYRIAGGQAMYVDLGWWDRKPPYDVLGGYHKVVVDAREPTAYFRRGFPADRFARTGLTIAPWRATGGPILLAGMSEKSARTRGLGPQQWETGMVAILREICPQRHVRYRPKPSWDGATPINGSIYSLPTQGLEAALRDCWAVVTHHSNVSVDALLAGIPIHCEGGVAIEASTRLVDLESPNLDCDREGLLADIAYCQWSRAEMSSGECLAHHIKYGIVRP